MEMTRKNQIEGFAISSSSACENFTNQLQVMKQHVEWEKSRLLQFDRDIAQGYIKEEDVPHLCETLERLMKNAATMRAILQSCTEIMHDLTVEYHQITELIEKEQPNT